MAKRGWWTLTLAAAGMTLGGSMAQAVTPAPPPPYPQPTPKPVASPIPPGGAQTVFDFTGLCTDCQALVAPDGAPSNTVSAQLVLAGYTLGQAIDFSNFYSFTYYGSDKVPYFEIFTSNAAALGGSIGGVPGPNGFYVSGEALPGYIFESATDGSWNINQKYVFDYGTNGSYVEEGAVTAVPEVATWGLLILGLGAVGARARLGRRHRAGRSAPVAG